MTNPLVRCSTCKRHIYASEATCPFCARAGMATSGSLAVALTAAASIALAGCGNDAPKNDPSTDVAPEGQKLAASQAAPNPAPPPVVAPVVTPTVVAIEPPVPVPLPSTAKAPAPPVTTTPAPTQTTPILAPVPAYGLPRPTAIVTTPRKPPSAYGAPPPPSDPLR